MPIVIGRHVQKPQKIRGKHVFSLEQFVEDQVSGRTDRLPAFVVGMWENRPAHPHSDQIRHIVFGSLRCLPTKQRQIITIRHIEGRKWREVSQRCGYSRWWCRVLELKALEQLRNMKPLSDIADNLQETENLTPEG